MRSVEIQKLIAAVTERFGTTEPYGTHPEETHGVGFTLPGIPVTFSVLTLDGLMPPGRYDVQIEAITPGEYVYADEFSLEEFLSLIQRYAGPKDQWPSIRQKA